MKRVSLLALVIACANASAVEEKQQTYGAILSATTEQSDNALRAPENEISERQDTLQAGVFALYENDLIELDTNYAAAKKYYDKESQRDRDSLTGRTSFKIGKDHHLVDLRVLHVRQKQLVSADAIDLEENQDEKQILTIQPSFHTRITPTDTFFIQGNATDVDYRYQTLSNSQREGATTGLQHSFSSVDLLGIFISHTDVDFEFLPELDYRMQSYAVSYAAQLRKLQYKLELGQSKMQSQFDKDDEADTNPYYLITASYATGYNQWDLSVTEQSSDSSMGLGDNAFGEDSGFGDSGSNKPDRIVLKRAQLSWRTTALCDRCTLNLSGVAEEREYLTQERQEQSNGVALGVGYNLSRSANIGARIQLRQQEFEGKSPIEDFDTTQIGVYYSYNFAGGTSVRLFASEFERKSDSELQDYTELRSGITLSHRF